MCVFVRLYLFVIHVPSSLKLLREICSKMFGESGIGPKRIFAFSNHSIATTSLPLCKCNRCETTLAVTSEPIFIIYTLYSFIRFCILLSFFLISFFDPETGEKCWNFQRWDSLCISFQIFRRVNMQTSQKRRCASPFYIIKYSLTVPCRLILLFLFTIFYSIRRRRRHFHVNLTQAFKFPFVCSTEWILFKRRKNLSAFG